MKGLKWSKAKKTLSLTMLLLFLTACERPEDVVIETAQPEEVYSRFELERNVGGVANSGIHDVYILIDKETSQKYIIWQGYKGGGITPLLEKGE